MLLIDSENQITFSLTLAGTTSPPSVRIVLELDPMVIYQAAKADGDKWTVNMKIPAGVKAGVYDYSVEVTVAGRIFVPLKSSIEIGSIEISISNFDINGLNPTPITIEPTGYDTPPEEYTPEITETQEPEVPEKIVNRNELGILLLDLLSKKPAQVAEQQKPDVVAPPAEVPKARLETVLSPNSELERCLINAGLRKPKF